jgi:hypothetical protein
MFLEPGKIKIKKSCSLRAKCNVFHCAQFDIIASTPLLLIMEIMSAHDM